MKFEFNWLSGFLENYVLYVEGTPILSDFG